MTIHRTFLISLLTLPCAFGYITQSFTTNGQTYTIKRSDNAGISFYLNNNLATSSVFSKNSNTTAAAQAAIAAWNALTTANVHFSPLQTTANGHDPSDCKSVISVASTPADISAVGGALAITAPAYAVSGQVCGVSTPGTLFDTDIIFSPAFTFSTDSTTATVDFQSVLTHELGHSLGANHSGLIGATMFWATSANQVTQRTLSADDAAFAAAVYPVSGANPGTLSGKVSASDGSAVKFSLITAIDPTAGTTFGSITAADGTYSIVVPAGSYIVSAEPFNPFVSSNNIYSSATSNGVLDPTQVTGGYLPTFLGGSASPTVTAVTAGNKATANITVTAGTSSLTIPAFAVGAPGGSGDITTPFGLVSAIPVASGQSIDIGMVTGGVDTSTTFLVFGRGISIKSGSIRQDTKVNFGSGNPLMRFTLDIPAQTDTTLATLWIVKGNNILAFSGGIVITPAAPVISNVLDAESARAAVTSGQWAAIYGSSLAATTRTWATADFTGGTAAGSPLPTSLDGVSVTVNSTPAGVYFVCSACNPNQINFVTPSNLATGKANVVVTNNGVVSAAFSTTVVQSSPSFFNYPAGTKVYALGVHINNGVTIGDPAVLAGTEKAHPGETVELFVNGIAPAPGGIIVPVTAFTQQVTVNAGSFPLTVSAPFLVAAGEFQINVTLPANMSAGNYTLTMTVPGGSTSDAGVSYTLPVGP